MGTSLFVAATNALRWVEVERRDFGTARRFRDDEILVIGVGMVPTAYYRVPIGRIRRWGAERRDAGASHLAAVGLDVCKEGDPGMVAPLACQR
jgi:hypothetical protein